LFSFGKGLQKAGFIQLFQSVPFLFKYFWLSRYRCGAARAPVSPSAEVAASPIRRAIAWADCAAYRLRQTSHPEHRFMNSPHLLAVGGAHIDRRGQVSGAYVAGASNPGIVSEEVGGGVFNALRNAVRHGVSASLLSVRGGDAAGENVERAIAEAGIEDLSAIFLDRSTPSYTALLDRSGELIAGLADMDLYDFAFAKQVGRAKSAEAMSRAAAVLADANVPEAALRKLVGLAVGRPLFAIAISPAKVTLMAGVLNGISCLFMNAREAAALSGLVEASATEVVGKLAEMGLAGGVITAGRQPLTGFDSSGRFTLTPPMPGWIADVTGAGDALAGTTIAAMMKGRVLRDAVREGMAAAMLTVQSKAAVPDYSDEEFAAALALVPEAEDLA
jgi:sugar/nucleoside kinase (ribokinase family)